jgi:hypothetical protein
MQKIKFILLLLITASCMAATYYATTWSGTSSNQMVTRAALTDAVTNGVFTAKQSFPSDSRLITKEMAQAYVNIATISGYSANQLVPKSTFTSAVEYYPHTVHRLFWGDGNTGISTSALALSNLVTADGSCIRSEDFYTLYARALDVGDRIHYMDYLTPYDPEFYQNDGAGGCDESVGALGYWIYDPSQNCALQVTNQQTGAFYIISKVFPSGSSPLNICIDAQYTSSSTMNFQAIAASAVNTNVICYYQFKVNGGSWQYGNVTITNGQITSGANSYNHGSNINEIEIAVYDFSPSISGSQNYVYIGQCF